MNQADISCVLEAHALNGECPTWDGRRGLLFWVDIRAPSLHAFDPKTGEDRRWEMPSWTGCFGLGETEIALALRTGLYALNPETNALRFLSAPPFDARNMIFNDGGCDPAGRLLAGPMHVPLDPPPATRPEAAPLWRYDGGGRWTEMSGPVKTSNGLAFSPDGRTMYHSDTAQKTIWAYDYDTAHGEAANRRVFARLDVNEGGPDGAAMDRDGFYWCAVYANACLMRFDPAGKLERRVDLPVRYCTMPAFGGPGLDTIYVTSAAFELPPGERERSPTEGSLFALPAPVPGLPARRWDGRE
jgi:sugar lactone lactonase YvrE